MRGYRYQSLSPTFLGQPIGGRSLLEASIEARIKITDTIGIVPFVDAGSAFADASPPNFKEPCGRRGPRPSLLTPDRADPAGCRDPAQPAQGRQARRALCQHRAGLLMRAKRAAHPSRTCSARQPWWHAHRAGTARAGRRAELSRQPALARAVHAGEPRPHRRGRRRVLLRRDDPRRPDLRPRGRLDHARPGQGSPWPALLARRLEIDALEVDRLTVARRPVATETDAAQAAEAPALPALPVKLIVKQFAMNELALGEKVLGQAARIAVQGDAVLGAPAEGLSLHLQATRLDAQAASPRRSITCRRARSSISTSTSPNWLVASSPASSTCRASPRST